MCFLAVPAIKNTGRSGCLPACDLATGKCMCFRQPLLPVFLTASTARKHLNSKGKFFWDTLYRDTQYWRPKSQVI